MPTYYFQKFYVCLSTKENEQSFIPFTPTPTLKSIAHIDTHQHFISTNDQYCMQYLCLEDRMNDR